MSSQQLDEEAIFHVARQIANPEGRATYLDQICVGDQALRDRVVALLKVHENEQDFLKSDAAPTLDHTPLTERPGTTIGRYHLREQIGEGGMGTVFVAEQERPIRRKVALKVIKPGMDSKAVVARFEAERQALALMDHPNIAKVLDAGTTDTGRPYFVMELVRGIPITEYCDQHKLTIRERLELFIQVCQAIQHAHQKAIIHRDIKPTNVLVTEQDGRAVAKVIDFGVAKALNQRLTERTIYTTFAQVVGTPLYMSPEQAALSAVDVDTRSDVYSLGVLLYELLTGTTPFDRARFEQAAYDEIRRIVREEEPPKPSTKISTLGEQGSTVAGNRRTDRDKLGRAVRGDLDWIVMKALEKERSRRYETANSLAADVERYLGSKPVDARSPSTGYRLHRFVRRNKMGVATASLLLITLCAGVIGTTFGLLKASQRNAELSQALQQLEDSAYANAIDAALTGDEDRAKEAIAVLEEAARFDSSSKIRIGMLEGLLNYARGEFSEAIESCQRVLKRDSQNFVARAILAKSCIHAGNDDQFPSQLAELRALEPRFSEEWLLLAAVEIMHDPQQSLRLLERVTSDSPLKLSTYAEANYHLALVTGNAAFCEESIKAFDHARLIIGPNAKNDGYQILAHTYAMVIARRQKDFATAEKHEREARELAKNLKKRFDDAGSNYCRWRFFWSTGHDDEKSWNAIKSTGTDGSYVIFVAADCLRRSDKLSEARANFDSVVSQETLDTNPYARIAKAYLWAGEPESRQEIDRLVSDLLTEDNLPLVRKHALYAWCLRGLEKSPDDADQSDEVSKIASAILTSQSELFEVMGERDVLVYLATPRPEELLANAANSQVKQSAAHFTIAMFELSRNNQRRAYGALCNCVNTTSFPFFEYVLAEALLERLGGPSEKATKSELLN